MKTRMLIVTLLAALTTCATWAQGVVMFQNSSQILGIDAPVFDVDCETRLSGPAYSAQLYVGKTLEGLAAVSPVVTFREGNAAGYVPQVHVVIEGTGLVYYQIRAWETSAGANYEEALTAGGKHGFSTPILVESVVPPGVGMPFGLESFCLVPEPSAGVLLAGGLAALALRRRT